MANPIVVNKVRYLGKDFDTIVLELKEYLRNRFTADEFSNFVESEQGIMLIELIAYALSLLTFYLDRQASETFISTALLNSNIALIARQLGFKIRGASAASGKVRVTLKSPLSSKLVLPIGTQLSAESLTFDLRETLVWDAGEVGPKDAVVLEGEVREEIFTSDGSPNQVFSLSIEDELFLGNKQVEVFVNGIAWTEVDFLTFEKENIFEVDYINEEIIFGDGIAGNIPPIESEILIRYRVHHGVKGNVKIGAINSTVLPVSVGEEAADLEVINIEPITNGDNGMILEQVRLSAPFVFKTVGRAVSEEDYNSIANSYVDPIFGPIGKAKALIVRNIDEDVFLNDWLAEVRDVLGTFREQQLRDYFNLVLHGGCKANIVQLHVVARDPVTRKYVQASSGLLKGLRERLDKIKESTVRIQFIDGSKHLYEVDVNIDIKVLDKYDRLAVRDRVKTNVEDFLLDKGFGEAVRISDLYDIVESVEGIDYSHIDIVEPVSKKTPEGDIEIDPFEILTLGTVVVNFI